MEVIKPHTRIYCKECGSITRVESPKKEINGYHRAIVTLLGIIVLLSLELAKLHI